MYIPSSDEYPATVIFPEPPSGGDSYQPSKSNIDYWPRPSMPWVDDPIIKKRKPWDRIPPAPPPTFTPPVGTGSPTKIDEDIIDPVTQEELGLN